ncbi:MAG: hypothetical protein P8J37_23420 [Fuerstiella sp.]|nr:hypothetical protein [Fuerstiella sp.]
MAIEFHCPYCTAIIRVPDAFAGKSGSCPKCATKLLVPTVGPAAGASAEPPLPGPPSQNAAASASVGDAGSAEHQLSAPSAPVGDPGGRDIPTIDSGSPPSVTRSLRKKQRRRKSQRIFAIAVPVVCFLLFFGVLGIVFFATEPELAGTLMGKNVGKFELPSAVVSLASLGLTEDEKANTQNTFENDPEAFLSTQMACRIRLDNSDLVTDISVGDGFSLFVVNPAGNQHLSKWISSHRIDINRKRMLQLTEAGADLCRDKVAKSAGSQVVFDAQRYRDDFGLSAHVSAFGYVVEAVTEQRRARCVHEDANGTLYFVLPVNTSQFTLRGREIDGGMSLFSGEYSVSVSTQASPPVTAADMISEDDSEKDKSELGASPDASAEMAAPGADGNDDTNSKTEKME